MTETITPQATLEPQTGVAYTVDPEHTYGRPRPFALVTNELVRLVARRGKGPLVETADSARRFGETILGMLAVRVLGDHEDGDEDLVVKVADQVTVDLLGSDQAAPSERIVVGDHAYRLGWVWQVAVPGVGKDRAVIVFLRKHAEEFVPYEGILATYQKEQEQARARAAERDRRRAVAQATSDRLDDWAAASPLPAPPKIYQTVSDSGHVTVHHTVLDALMDAAGHPDEHLGRS